MTRRLLVLSIAIAALCVTWFALRAPSERSSTTLTSTIAGGIDLTSARVELVEPAQSGKGAQSSSATREVARTIDAAEPEIDWLEGIVEFPPGTPADENAFVSVLEPPSEDDPIPAPVRFPVDADGRFRVSIPRYVNRAKLSIVGRYLYCSAATVVDRGSPPAELVLRPELGGALRVQLVPTAAATARGVELTRARVIAEGASSSRTGIPRRSRSMADENGIAELGGLDCRSNEPWRVRVDLRGYVGSRALEWTPRPGEIHSLSIDLAVAAAFAGIVRDESGARLDRIPVTLTIGEPSARVTSSRVLTGEDGAFRFETGQVGPAHLRIDPSGFLPLDMGPWPSFEAACVETIDVVLKRGLEITGIVRLSDGTPIEDADVSAFELREEDGARVRDVRTKSERGGRFRLAGLQDCAYTVKADELLPLDPKGRAKNNRVHWKAHVARVAAGTRGIELVLDPGAIVSGRVVDELGSPVPEAGVRANAPSTRGIGTLSTKGSLAADGRFEIHGLTDGVWSLWALGSTGIRSVPVEIQLPRDSSADIVLVVPRSGRIVGVVRDASGVPVEGASVRIVGSRYEGPVEGGDPARERTATTNSRGVYRLLGLAGVEQHLIASRYGSRESGVVTVILGPGETREGVDIVLVLDGDERER